MWIKMFYNILSESFQIVDIRHNARSPVTMGTKYAAPYDLKPFHTTQKANANQGELNGQKY